MRLRIILLAATIFLFTSCYFENKIQKQGAIESRDGKHEAFIELDNGEMLTFQTLKIKSPPLQYQYLLGDDKKLDIAANKIKAFQTAGYYAYRIYDQPDLMIGKLPYSDLFAVRIVNGKIELFVISSKESGAYGPNQSGFVKRYYLRKGKNTSLIPASEVTLKNMILDNKSVLEDFNKLYKRSYLFKSTMKVLEEYN